MTNQIHDHLHYLFELILSLPFGERANLRRIDPQNISKSGLNLYRLLTTANISIYSSSIQQWATIVKLLSIAVSHLPENTSITLGLGKAAEQAGISEARISRLLASREHLFRDQALRITKYISSKGITCNWIPLCELVLIEEKDENRADDLRMQIAKDYYQKNT